MTELPSGWVEVPIGDVCRVVGGSTPSTKAAEYWDGEIPWLTPDDLARDRSQYVSAGRRTISEAGYASCSTQMVPAGTVLFTSRAPIGYAAIARRAVCTNQGFKSFVPPEGISSEYLYWHLRWATPAIRDMGSGTTFAEISGKVTRMIPLRVAPRAEQDRIVAAIEEQLSRLEEADGALRSARRRVATCRRAVLNGLANTSGSLTRLADAATEMRYGTSVKCSYDGSGLPVLRIPNVQRGRVDTEDLKFAIDANADLKPCLVERGDLLFVRTNGSRDLIGRVAPVETDMELAFASYLIRLRPELDRVHSPFISMILAAPRYRWELESLAATTAGQYNLNLKSIGSIEVPLPPIEEQLVRAAEVEQQLSILAAIETSIEHALVRSDHLRRAILGMAFGGRLVPQDPGEEPAVELLSHIAAERPTKPAAHRRKRA